MSLFREVLSDHKCPTIAKTSQNSSIFSTFLILDKRTSCVFSNLGNSRTEVNAMVDFFDGSGTIVPRQYSDGNSGSFSTTNRKVPANQKLSFEYVRGVREKVRNLVFFTKKSLTKLSWVSK